MKLSNNKILITGGASGIGLGLTERFIKENNTVIICGRREEVLLEAKEKFPSVITKVCDLSKEEERIELYNWISKHHSDINVLVNNAGIQNCCSYNALVFLIRNLYRCSCEKTHIRCLKNNIHIQLKKKCFVYYS